MPESQPTDPSTPAAAADPAVPVAGTLAQNFASRKFAIAAFGSLAALGLTLTGHMTGAEWASAQEWILGLYGGANVVDRKIGGG